MESVVLALAGDVAAPIRNELGKDIYIKIKEYMKKVKANGGIKSTIRDILDVIRNGGSHNGNASIEQQTQPEELIESKKLR